MANNFVKMKKGDEIIEVSPLVVEAHQRHEWVVVGERPLSGPAAEAEAARKKADAEARAAEKKAAAVAEAARKK